MQWHHVLQQIGGRNAISIWSWVVTIPLAILISSTYRPGVSAADVLTWVAIVLAVHVALGVLMWIASRTFLPNVDRQSRPLMAVTFFALLGLIRALVLQFAQDNVGIAAGVFSERLAVNIIGSVVALSAIAIIVDDYRTDESIVSRLERARDTLMRIRDNEESTLRAADLEVLTQVQARVEDELSRAGTDSAGVRAIASDIVRPMSHNLARSGLGAITLEVEHGSPQIRLTFADAFGRLQPPSPLAVAIVVQATILGAVAVRFGAPIAVGNAVVGGALIWLGCWMASRLLPLPREPRARLVALAAALAAIGALASAITGAIVTPIASTFPAGLIGVAGGVCGTGLALSLWAAVNAGRQARQEALAEAVGEEAVEIERLRGVIEQRRLQAARFLHGTIQGELIAAALRGDTPERIRDTVSQRFAEYGSFVARPAEVQVSGVVDAWSTVLDIDASVDPACWPLLDEHPERLRLLVDALSEGLTNVVRHATGTQVAVRIRLTGSDVTLVIASSGAREHTAAPGIGLAQLQARGARVSLQASQDRTEFAVAI